MRLIALVFAAALVTMAFGLLFYTRDRRLAWTLFAVGGVLLALLAGGLFGLFGG